MKTPSHTLAVAFVFALFALPAQAATISVVQQGRSFKPAEVTVHPGDVVQISNQDEFIHQIYVDSDKMNFDSDEQLPGHVISIPFPNTGDYSIRCHIHPKMLLTVHVK